MQNTLTPFENCCDVILLRLSLSTPGDVRQDNNSSQRLEILPEIFLLHRILVVYRMQDFSTSTCASYKCLFNIFSVHNIPEATHSKFCYIDTHTLTQLHFSIVATFPHNSTVHNLSSVE